MHAVELHPPACAWLLRLRAAPASAQPCVYARMLISAHSRYAPYPAYCTSTHFSTQIIQLVSKRDNKLTSQQMKKMTRPLVLQFISYSHDPLSILNIHSLICICLVTFLLYSQHLLVTPSHHLHFFPLSLPLNLYPLVYLSRFY